MIRDVHHTAGSKRVILDIRDYFVVFLFEQDTYLRECVSISIPPSELDDIPAVTVLL